MKIINITLISFIFTLFLSCNNKTKNIDPTINESEETLVVNDYDNQLEEALYDGYFIKNQNGYNVSISGSILYLLRENASEDEKKQRFFLHILPSGHNLINLDFEASEHLITKQLSPKFANLQIYKLQLPEIGGPYTINVGQFEFDTRLWETYIDIDLLNKADYSYKNEYVNYVTNNHYLNNFKKAFDEGYFMKHQDTYDLLLDDHTLYYIMTDKDRADLENMFFLHIKFDGKEEILNLDFYGKSFEVGQLLGKEFESYVVLKRDIPNRGKITELATGQFVDESRIWSYVYHLEKMYDDMAFIYDDQYGDVLR